MEQDHFRERRSEALRAIIELLKGGDLVQLDSCAQEIYETLFPSGCVRIQVLEDGLTYFCIVKGTELTMPE